MMLKRILLIVLGLLILFIGYLFMNLARFESKQIAQEVDVPFEVPEAALDRFSQSLKIQTISPENPDDFDSTAFLQFNEFLSTTYPLVDSLLEKKTFLHYSHLIKWEGKNPKAPAIILMGHHDVVPVISENKVDWKYGAFEGTVAEDTIWGRGTLDDKIVVISLLESAELLLKKGFQPERTVYFSFGHDEEVGGYGAQAIADYLDKEDIEVEFVLDEGMVITSGLVPGVEKDVALIGTAEKGFVSIHLSVEIEGGHSSMPQQETAIDVLARAVHQVKANPFPSTVSPPLKDFFEFIGPEMSFPLNLVFANSNLFEPIIVGIYEGSSSTNAGVRTTTSPTVFHSGIKENIIPKKASAIINFRIIPGETVETVMERVARVIDDERVQLRQGDFVANPSPVSSTSSEAFDHLHKVIRKTYPQTLVAPNLAIPATDSRHFTSIAQEVYRFSPIRLNSSNINSIHGVNERIAISEYFEAIQFYTAIITDL